MHKKSLVLAIAAALAVPAAYAKDDADSVVELYGKLYPEIVQPHGSGATAAGSAHATLGAAPTGENSFISRTEMESSNSRFGVRGHEKLGHGLKAVFQLESEFHIDSNDSKFAQRNSFVGLDSAAWGTVKLGRMDTPFKTYGDDISFLGISSGNFVSSSNLLRKTGFGTSSASSFHLRRANMVQYESPDRLGPLDFTVQYSTDEADTATRHPHVWSAGVHYAAGPVEVSLAHEIHWDLFGGSKNSPSAMSNASDQNVNSKDQATQAMIKWQATKVHRFEADIIRKEYKENANTLGRFESYKNNAYELIWDARWSRQWRTALEYIHSDKGSCSRFGAVCVTDGLDGSQLQFGVAYYFSKRTMVFAMGALLRNGFSARYNNSAEQAPSVGEDIDQYAIGMSHSF